MRVQPIRRRFRRVATPGIRQGETTECGLAALAILLAHHGRPVPLETLRAEAGSTRLGVTARTLLRLARRHGMEARAFRKEPDGLAGLGFPLIVHSRFIHFLVVEAMTDREVRVNDPACGPRRIPLEDFADDFTGVALTVRPVASPLPARPRPARWTRRLAPRPRDVAMVFHLSLLAATAAVAAALGIGALVDGRAGAGPALAFALPLAVAGGWARDRWSARLGARLSDGAVAATLDRLARLPALWFARRSPEAVAAAPLAGAVLQTRAGMPVRVAELLPALLAPAVAGLALDPWTMAGPVAAASLDLVLLLAVHGRRGGAVARLGGGVGGGTPGPVLPDPATLRAFDSHRIGGRDADLFGQLAGRHAAHLADAQAAASALARLAAARAGLAAAGTALALGAGGLGVVEGRLSPGVLVTLLALGVALHPPLDRLGWRLAGRSSLADAQSRLDDAASAPVMDPLPVEEAPRPLGRLVLERVGFRAAADGPPLFDGLDLSAEPGQSIGIAGPSGVGKSVLAKLVCGLLEPETGRVLLDGRPVGGVARRFPGAVALVDRSSPVETGTVADNLRFGDAEPNDAELRSTLDLVALWRDLEPRGGLSLALSRGGAELSGGQRRRLALARALLRRPALLVLDEALDALEPALDRAIRDRLRGLGCTVVIVSGRPGSLDGCDRVVELGTPPGTSPETRAGTPAATGAAP